MERRSGLVCWNVSLGEVIREMTYMSVLGLGSLSEGERLRPFTIYSKTPNLPRETYLE